MKSAKFRVYRSNPLLAELLPSLQIFYPLTVDGHRQFRPNG